ncbi:MAG: UDP-glucose 4-epimerase GalE [Acidimicrobiia bacterium]|nr:UDP-glucose 4-epimerase GalE [Acidimicrobiia bacterium]
MKILLTGGCGFIGSHQAVVLLEAGHDVVIVDDLSNARATVVDRIAEIAGRRPQFVGLDVRDTKALVEVMATTGCDSIIHFAGLKHVAESMERAVDYLDVNVGGMTSLLRAADVTGIRRFIFSSSGSIYGPASTTPIPEDAPIQPTNPYSRSKAVCEEILSAVCAVDPTWAVMSLRYFNPAGAHPSGLIGEDPTNLISNIVPVLMEAAVGEMEAVPIYGTDFDTPDGTAVRDYIHVMDVVEAHSTALDLLPGTTGFEALNIGRGQGISVRQLVAAAENALGSSIPVVERPRRPGDVAALVAATDRARERLGQTDYRAVDTIFSDAWRFRVGRSSVWARRW